MTTAYVGMGANLGDRLATLRAAATTIAGWPDTSVTAASSVIETRPIGPTRFPFLNAVIKLSTKWSGERLLEQCLGLEAAHGRVRARDWAPRELDLDVLCMTRDGQLIEVSTPTLELPHPRITGRDFVLLGLAELAPDLRLRGSTSQEWLAALADADRSWLRTLREPLLPN